ncbi:MAG: helix-turn-helix transcriptional regulator [Clostridia bacterium]|nr:helix-turn-helix transcriptional regulator [Clostridia bacterium]
MSKFVERFNELINEKDCKLECIAKEANQSIYDLYRWKQGKSKYFPSLNKLIALADYFSCSILFLLGEEEENSLTNPNKDLPCFSERLKSIIKEKRIPITQIAKRCDLSCTTMIYDWINGKAKPRVEVLIKLAKVLDCSPDYLLGRE